MPEDTLPLTPESLGTDKISGFYGPGGTSCFFLTLLAFYIDIVSWIISVDQRPKLNSYKELPQIIPTASKQLDHEQRRVAQGVETSTDGESIMTRRQATLARSSRAETLDPISEQSQHHISAEASASVDIPPELPIDEDLDDFEELRPVKFGLNLNLLTILVYHCIVWRDMYLRRSPLTDFSQLGSLIAASSLYEATKPLTLYAILICSLVLSLAIKIESKNQRSVKPLLREFFISALTCSAFIFCKFAFSCFTIENWKSDRFPKEADLEDSLISEELLLIFRDAIYAQNRTNQPSCHSASTPLFEPSAAFLFLNIMFLAMPCAMGLGLMCAQLINLESGEPSLTDEVKEIMSPEGPVLNKLLMVFAVIFSMFAFTLGYFTLTFVPPSSLPIWRLLIRNFKIVPEIPGAIYDMDQFFAVTGGILTLLFSCHHAFKLLKLKKKLGRALRQYLHRKDPAAESFALEAMSRDV